MKENFSEYVNRVSRARHLLLSGYGAYDYFEGISLGYHNSLKFIKTGPAHEAVEDLVGVCRGFALKAKAQAIVAQDRTLTYREDKL